MTSDPTAAEPALDPAGLGPRPVPLPGGQVVVPGNRWDLAPAVPLRPTSVVIPYYDAEADLRRLLAGLDAQTHAPHEVIVVDDGSPTRPAREVLADRPDVVVLHQADAGVRPAAARNRGAAAASGDVVAFLDGDVVPHPDCLARLAALPSALPDAIVVGRRAHADLDGLDDAAVRRLLEDPGRDPGRWFDDMGWLDSMYRGSRDLLEVDVRSWRGVISAVMAVDRELLLELGGFDGARVGYGGEDWELAHRALHAGAVLAHAPGALAVHNGPDLAGRPDARDLKAEETLWLLPRITDRTFRPRGLLAAHPRVSVVLDDAGWDEPTLLRCIDSWLAAVADCRVHLTGRAEVPAWARADPRVRRGDPGSAAAAAAVGGPLAHVEVRCDVVVPALVDAAAAGLLARVDPGGADRVVVADDVGVVAVVTAQRTALRVDRAARRGGDTGPAARAALWEALAAVEHVAAADGGVRRCGSTPDLEAALDGGG